MICEAEFSRIDFALFYFVDTHTPKIVVKILTSFARFYFLLLIPKFSFIQRFVVFLFRLNVRDIFKNMTRNVFVTSFMVKTRTIILDQPERAQYSIKFMYMSNYCYNAHVCTSSVGSSTGSDCNRKQIINHSMRTPVILKE